MKCERARHEFPCKDIETPGVMVFSGIREVTPIGFHVSFSLEFSNNNSKNLNRKTTMNYLKLINCTILKENENEQ